MDVQFVMKLQQHFGSWQFTKSWHLHGQKYAEACEVRCLSFAFFSLAPTTPTIWKTENNSSRINPWWIILAIIPCSTKCCVLFYSTLAYSGGKASGSLSQWLLYRLNSEVLQLMGAGFNRRKTSLDGETNPVLLGYLLRGSVGILYAPFAAAQSRPETTSIYGWSCHHVISQSQRHLMVSVTEGCLQQWGSRGWTSQGSEPFSEPPTNDRWTLDCYAADAWILLLDAYHNMHLLILSGILREQKL